MRETKTKNAASSKRYYWSHLEKERNRKLAYYHEQRAKKKGTLRGVAYSVIRSSRVRATLKETDHTLDVAWVIDTAQRQDERCLMTGAPFYYGEESLHPYRLSLDRIESDKGYTQDNVRLVSLIYNRARSIAQDAEVLGFARLLVAFQDRI